MKISAPNTHAILDPAWARSVVQDHYAAQLELFTEALRFAADLALRSLSSAPDDIPNHMVLAVLFRQAIAAADAVGVLLTEGAVDQAQLQLRAQMEARWGLILALRDPQKWGQHIYVTSLRENRSRARRLISETPEYAAGKYEREIREKYGQPNVGELSEDNARKYVVAVDAILAKPENVAISASFDAFLLERKYEGPWYFDGAAPKFDQAKNIRGLARLVGSQGEYDSVYHHTSYHVHGGYMGIALSLDDLGAYVAPIRSPEGLRQALVLAFSLLADCCLRVIRKWRAEEEPRFVSKYADKWRALIRDCPDVQLQREKAVNR